MSTRMPDPFASRLHATEMTCASNIKEWINEVIENEGLHLGRAEVEMIIEDGARRCDVIIPIAPESQQPLCIISVKLPAVDPFHDEVIDDAYKYALRLKAPYFCTCNLNRLVWFDFQKVRDRASLSEQINDRYDLASISDPDRFSQLVVALGVKKELKHFLIDLVEVHTGKKPRPKQPIDETLIYRLHSAVTTLATHYEQLVRDKVAQDSAFENQLRAWFVQQVWSFTGQDEDYEKVARQAAYLLVNKLLFYAALEQHLHLSPLSIPDDLTDSGILKGILQAYFKRVLDIDYQTIFSTDFIDALAFPQHIDAVNTVKGLVRDINRYKVAELGYDIIGRIFERLIPESERHKLGQYFTNTDVVDIILRFCLGDDVKAKVLDPACGTGTFLVRAYQHKKLINPRLAHNDILPTLWGFDIAKFPAHLATINLAINDLSVRENYPRILRADFFDQSPGTVEFQRPPEVELEGLGLEGVRVERPRYFDVVVGNPPYTRQEEMEDIVGAEGYKEELIKKALYDEKGKQLTKISKRAGIHAYFFVHGFKFLRNGSHFGFIVSNSWLDVDYGKGLQEFFLKNYKITAILESKVERWFAEADINTCIVILEKCSGERRRKERDANLVRFVQLLKPLRHFIPPAERMWERRVERLRAVDALVKLILGKWDFYEDEDIKIFPKKQRGLGEEGYDEEKKRYVGSKWGKYLRAPDIFFRILKKGKNKLVPLKEVADVRFGIKTGANKFFYLTDEDIQRWGIEREFWMHPVSEEDLEQLRETPFWPTLERDLWRDESGQAWLPNYVIKSPRECKGILVDPADLKYRVLMVHKPKSELRGTKVLEYIRWGESRGFHERPTCTVREPSEDSERQRATVAWYDLGKQEPADLLWFKAFNVRVVSPLNAMGVYSSDRFYWIHLGEGLEQHVETLASVLNSTVAHLIVEIWGRVSLGQGALDNMTYEAATMPIIDPRKVEIGAANRLGVAIRNLANRPINSVFDEIGADRPEDVILDKVKPDRRELDRIVMGEILGLTEEEQFEVYRAVVDLVRARIERARSVRKKRRRVRGGVDVEAFTQMVLDKIDLEGLSRLYHEEVLPYPHRTVDLPRTDKEPIVTATLMGAELKAGRRKLHLASLEEARYLKAWIQMGMDSVAVPEDSAHLTNVTDKLESVFQKAKAILDEYLATVVDKKLRKQLAGRVWAGVRKTLTKNGEKGGIAND